MANQYITSSTTISASCQGCDVIASGGFFTITLPPASSVPDDCQITIKNADVASGKWLSGFPADANQRLYPEQSISVSTENGEWITTATPGRFKLTPECCTIYVACANMGGSNSNDGLSPTTPLLNNSTVFQVIYDDLDLELTSVIWALVAGSTFVNDPIQVSGQPLGDNLIQVSVYGSGSVTIQCENTAAVVVSDNGEVNLAWSALNSSASAILQGNMANQSAQAAGIYQHNNGLFDMSGNVTIIGSGKNGAAVFFDGPCPGASSSAVISVAGTFGDIWRMDEGGGRYTLGGEIIPIEYQGANVWANDLFWIGGENELILSLSLPGGYASLGPSVVTDDGLLITNGVVIPGGTTTQNNGRIQQSK